MVLPYPSKLESAVRFRYPAPNTCPGGGMVDTLVLEASVARRASSSLAWGTMLYLAIKDINCIIHTWLGSSVWQNVGLQNQMSEVQILPGSPSNLKGTPWLVKQNRFI